MSGNIKYKICKKCSEKKMLGLFYVNKTSKDNHDSTCIMCRKNEKTILKGMTGLSKPDRSKCSIRHAGDKYRFIKRPDK